MAELSADMHQGWEGGVDLVSAAEVDATAMFSVGRTDDGVDCVAGLGW